MAVLRVFPAALVTVFAAVANGQERSAEAPGAQPGGGFVLLSPKDARASYPIDMQGRVMHSWPQPDGQNVSVVARGG